MPQVSLSEWIGGIQHGHLASFPTDTVPALAARPEAGDRIFSFKRRPPEKPLILMAANWSDLLPYVVGSSAEQASWQQLTQAHWPGQLTLVLPASDRLPLAINPNQTGTVGIRIPNHPVALALLNATGALATTSVNRSGQPALIAQADIEAQFPELL
ncbi:MAG: L-threonylcarbamoyladenylate synthase, partial [Cyanobacteria bacterium P01_H01_bin.119]